MGTLEQRALALCFVELLKLLGNAKNRSFKQVLTCLSGSVAAVPKECSKMRRRLDASRRGEWSLGFF